MTSAHLLSLFNMSVTLKRVAPGEVKALALDPIDDATRAQAAAIVRDVMTGGEAKLLEIATKFGDIKEGENRLPTRRPQPRHVPAARPSMDGPCAGPAMRPRAEVARGADRCADGTRDDSTT